MIVDTLKTKHVYRPILSNEDLRAIGANYKRDTDFPVCD